MGDSDSSDPGARELRGLLPALSTALGEVDERWHGVELAPLPDKGLAHHHVALSGCGVLARIPKQSQLRLDADANLTYQAACFERASASVHAPRLHAVLQPSGGQPSGGLPRGALLVDHIDGRAAMLPDDLPAIVTALAGIHSLPLPAPADRPPIWDDADPLSALAAEIDVQAGYLDAAALDPRGRATIDRELARLAALVERPDRPDRHLISFDAHPGNFLIRPDGSAVLVDLEKCRYSYPALDLAHATLYTSTTWEQGISLALTPQQIASCYAIWTDAVDWHSDGAWNLPLRRAMWLWSVTWCAKWRVDDSLDAAVIRRLTEEFDLAEI